MSSTPRGPLRDSTTALPAPQEQSGIPEVASSGLPSPPSSPPLAAITSSNEITLTPKAKRQAASGTASSRRGGATLRIREECERFFCESMRTAFFGEKDAAPRGSGLTSVYHHHQQQQQQQQQQQLQDAYDGYADGNGYFAPCGGSNSRDRVAADFRNGQLCTPPDDDYPPIHAVGSGSVGSGSGSGSAYLRGLARGGAEITAWLEIWDYAGGASFRAFMAEDRDEKSMFVFFDSGVVGRDLKQALVALIELAESPLACSQLVICVDRSMSEEDAKTLEKGLKWAGFSLTTLDYWAHGLDVTSEKWLFMGMEV